MQQFDAGTYGRSFADVYDEWYPADAVTTACVEFLAELAGPDASVLELGVGTGRLALPLAAGGATVTGVDAAEEMLERLRAKDVGAAVRTVVADVGAPDSWPTGTFDLVVAVCNLLCNVSDPAAQEACVAGAAHRLVPGGHLVIEAFEPAPPSAGPRIAASEVRGDVVVLIVSETDADTGIVTGQHVELRDGEPVRLRPWRIRMTTPAEIDAWAAHAGLERIGRMDTWGDDGPAADGLVTVYRRPAAPDGATDGATDGAAD